MTLTHILAGVGVGFLIASAVLMFRVYLTRRKLPWFLFSLTFALSTVRRVITLAVSLEYLNSGSVSFFNDGIVPAIIGLLTLLATVRISAKASREDVKK